MAKYFFASCVYNDTSAIKLYKYHPAFISKAFVYEAEDYPNKDYILQVLLSGLKFCYEPATVLSCVEWNKEQYECFNQ